jgi:hypothetical protein
MPPALHVDSTLLFLYYTIQHLNTAAGHEVPSFRRACNQGDARVLPAALDLQGFGSSFPAIRPLSALYDFIGLPTL